MRCGRAIIANCRLPKDEASVSASKNHTYLSCAFCISGTGTTLKLRLRYGLLYLYRPSWARQQAPAVQRQQPAAACDPTAWPAWPDLSVCCVCVCCAACLSIRGFLRPRWYPTAVHISMRTVQGEIDVEAANKVMMMETGKATVGKSKSKSKKKRAGHRRGGEHWPVAFHIPLLLLLPFVAIRDSASLPRRLSDSFAPLSCAKAQVLLSVQKGSTQALHPALFHSRPAQNIHVDLPAVPRQTDTLLIPHVSHFIAPLTCNQFPSRSALLSVILISFNFFFF